MLSAIGWDLFSAESFQFIGAATEGQTWRDRFGSGNARKNSLRVVENSDCPLARYRIHWTGFWAEWFQCWKNKPGISLSSTGVCCKNARASAHAAFAKKRRTKRCELRDCDDIRDWPDYARGSFSTLLPPRC